MKVALGTVYDLNNFIIMKDRRLDVKHVITTILKKTEKIDGQYIGEYRLAMDDDGNFIEVSVKSSQMNIFD